MANCILKEIAKSNVIAWSGGSVYLFIIQEKDGSRGYWVQYGTGQNGEYYTKYEDAARTYNSLVMDADEIPLF